MGLLPNRVQHVAANVLATTATVLGTAAEVMSKAASTLRPEREDGGRGAADASQIVEIYESRGRVKEPDQVAVPDAPPRAAVPSTHVEALAQKPAAEVIDAVDMLSTDELRRLLEHEQTHKRRKTVLAAIERTAGGQPTA